MHPRSPESGFQLKTREIFDFFVILLEFLCKNQISGGKDFREEEILRKS